MNKTRVLRSLYHSVIIGAGFSTLALEMITSRVLSPYFGTTLDVWGAILTVSLTALACGYFCGERTVKKFKADALPAIFVRRAFLAVVFTIVGISVIYPLASHLITYPVAIGAFVGSAILIFPCFFLTASLTPILVTVEILTAKAEKTDSPELRGKTGQILAESTIGSVFGALLCSYVFIPAATIETVMIITMVPLFVSASAVLIVHKSFMNIGVRLCQIAVIAAAAFPVFTGKIADAKEIGFGSVKARQLEVVRTGYGTVRILDNFIKSENTTVRYFLIDGRTQGITDSKDGKSLAAYIHATANMLSNNPVKYKSVLILGGGITASIARETALKGIKTDVVDIMPHASKLAEKYFSVPSSVKFITSDARTYLNACKKPYDAIVIDVFGGYGVPDHMMTKETFSAAAKCLSPGGIVTINGLRSSEYNHPDAIVRATLETAFPYVDMYTTTEPMGPISNSIWIASDKPIDTPKFFGGNEPGFLKKELEENIVYTAVPAGGKVATDSYPAYVFAMEPVFRQEHLYTLSVYGSEVMKP